MYIFHFIIRAFFIEWEISENVVAELFWQSIYISWQFLYIPTILYKLGDAWFEYNIYISLVFSKIKWTSNAEWSNITTKLLKTYYKRIDSFFFLIGRLDKRHIIIIKSTEISSYVSKGNYYDKSVYLDLYGLPMWFYITDLSVTKLIKVWTLNCKITNYSISNS